METFGESSTPRELAEMPSADLGEAAVGLTSRFRQWLVFSAIYLTALTAICAHAPSRVRLIGLFSAAFAVIAGTGLAVVGKMFRLPRQRALLTVVAVGLVFAELGLSFESSRLQAREIQHRQEQQGVNHTAAFLLQTAKPPSDPQSRKLFDEMTDSISDAEAEQKAARDAELRFTGYLKRRLTGLGEWRSPWPELFWLVEIASAVMVGVLAAYRVWGNQLSSE